MHYQWVLRVACILLGLYGKRGSLVLTSSSLFHRNLQAHVLLLHLLWIQQTYNFILTQILRMHT